jgi:hypothetical protein
MFKRAENRKKLAEINERLDKKARILYIAYKNGKLDLDSLNDDMRGRIVNLEKEEKGQRGKKISDKLNKSKVSNIKKALENLDNLNKEETDEEKDSEPELSESIRDKMTGKNVDENKVEELIKKYIDEMKKIACEHEGWCDDDILKKFFDENYDEIKDLMYQGWGSVDIFIHFRKKLEDIFNNLEFKFYFDDGEYTPDELDNLDEKIITKFDDFKTI